MALAQEDIAFIKNHLGEWLAEQSLGKPPAVYEIELRERMVRVEEELRHQRELMRQGFEQMDKRFEAMQVNMDRRFEQVDKRFEAMQANMDKRFEQVDKRFEQVDKRFDEMLKRHDQHFLWVVGFIATSAGLLITAVRFL
jgi:ABC-type phosphate transport system auxiliary subunit